MASDELHVAHEVEPGFHRQYTNCRERYGHEGRLCILGEGQLLGRTFPHDLAELVAEGRIDLIEDGARGRKRAGERLAHAEGLAALPWKHESGRHSARIPARFGPERDWARQRCQASAQAGTHQIQTRRGVASRAKSPITATNWSRPGA